MQLTQPADFSQAPRHFLEVTDQIEHVSHEEADEKFNCDSGANDERVDKDFEDFDCIAAVISEKTSPSRLTSIEAFLDGNFAQEFHHMFMEVVYEFILPCLVLLESYCVFLHTEKEEEKLFYFPQFIVMSASPIERNKSQ